jgi:hypothetical protein
VSEVSLDFPRAWVEFPDPADPGRVIRADLTWLTSRWTCIFGRGCHGIDATAPDAGCCTLGAHFADRGDRARVRRVARTLGPDDWQHRAEGRTGGVVERDADGAEKTRVVDGACIFLNRADFPGGAGCALHRLALRTGQSVVATKPEVCWQLPLRRTATRDERPDGTTVEVVTVTEFDRRGWGAGGHDLDWYCSGSPEAHIARVPVVESSRDELVALLGQAAYDMLLQACHDHLTARRRPVHPATRAAGRR